MAVHRYWRVLLPLAYAGGNLQLSEFHLFAGGVRVDATATLTCSTTPVSGLVASLKDDDLNTLVELSAGSVLTWDLGLGNDQDVTNFQIGGGDARNVFPAWVEGLYSDDGTTWVAESALLFIGPAWPGARTKTAGTPMASDGFLSNFQYITSVSNNGEAEPFSGFGVPVDTARARTNYIFDPAARGRIIGTVKRKSDPSNIPLKRRVRLYRDRDGMLIREGWSTTAGDYVFEYVEEAEAYTVISHDYQHNYRAVAADNLTLANGGVELM